MVKPLIASLIFLASGICSASTQETSQENRTEPVAEVIHACNDAQTLAESLHIQRLPLDDESKSKLLDEMGIKIYQNHYFNLMYARRISGDCVDHLDGINGSIFHFDTGVSLMLAGGGDGVFYPYPGNYQHQVVFDNNFSTPEKMPQQFTRAIGVSQNARTGNIDKITHFIGIRDQNGKSQFIPYERRSSGGFHIGDKIFEVNNKIIGIRYILDRFLTGPIQFLLPDENGLILLSFMWVHKDIIERAENASFLQPYKAPAPIPATTDSICLDVEMLSRSVHFKTSYWKENESEIELLNSLGVGILPDNGIRLMSISYIDGECLEHLQDVTRSLLYFDTGVILERTDKGAITPVLGLRDAPEYRHTISPDAPHPERNSYQFIEAIGTGWGHSIGVWEKNGSSIVTLYESHIPGKFHLLHDLLLFQNKMINIKATGHIHNPSVTLWLLLENGENIMSLTFFVYMPRLD